MEKNNENLVNLSFKQKLEWGLHDAKEKANQVLNWVGNHPAETVAIIGCTVGAVAEARRIGDRITSAADDRRSRLTVYCNDVQGRVRLKHELNYKENLELRDRMNNGQTRFEALGEMNLLK